jgi:hypothetical protein
VTDACLASVFLLPSLLPGQTHFALFRNPRTLGKNSKAMKRFFFTLLVLILFTSACKEKSEERDHRHDAEAPDVVDESPNLVLYNEVMKIHDEVMPRLEDIYRKKESLKNQIANTPSMPEEKKKTIDAAIAKLDSASEGMMDWMHDFEPLPDSVGEEKAREYLESEMEKIKKVRSNILQALEEADKN